MSNRTTDGVRTTVMYVSMFLTHKMQHVLRPPCMICLGFFFLPHRHTQHPGPFAARLTFSLPHCRQS